VHAGSSSPARPLEHEARIRNQCLWYPGDGGVDAGRPPAEPDPCGTEPLDIGRNAPELSECSPPLPLPDEMVESGGMVPVAQVLPVELQERSDFRGLKVARAPRIPRFDCYIHIPATRGKRFRKANLARSG